MNAIAIVENVIDSQSPWKLPRLEPGFTAYPYTKSIEEWNSLLTRANSGDGEAECEVAWLYDDGCKAPSGKILVRRSQRKAAEWFLRSAEHGFGPAQNTIGVYLGDGTGIARDPIEALRWLKGAHRAGESSAANNIAITYRQYGDFCQAVRWFRASIASGDDETRIQLGVHQYWGIGVRTDHDAAIINFKKATKAKFITEAGRDDAFFYLGVAYLEGKGIRKSISSARRMLERANRDNDHPAAGKLLKLLDNERK